LLLKVYEKLDMVDQWGVSVGVDENEPPDVGWW